MTTLSSSTNFNYVWDNPAIEDPDHIRHEENMAIIYKAPDMV